jgi:hypothetical protein
MRVVREGRWGCRRDGAPRADGCMGACCGVWGVRVRRHAHAPTPGVPTNPPPSPFPFRPFPSPLQIASGCGPSGYVAFQKGGVKQLEELVPASVIPSPLPVGVRARLSLPRLAASAPREPGRERVQGV